MLEVATGGFVVATSVFFADDVVLVVDVWDEAMMSSATWAG
jgi:hypothetical protein